MMLGIIVGRGQKRGTPPVYIIEDPRDQIKAEASSFGEHGTKSERVWGGRGCGGNLKKKRK